MMIEGTNKLALVTGGSSGMGLEYARQLAAAGYDLILVSNQQEELKKCCAELERDYGVQVSAHFQDLAEDDAAEALFSFCRGNIPDLLVLNAGIFFFKELSAQDCAKAEKMINLHVLTNTKLTMLFGEEMKKRGSGRIILMSSMTANFSSPGISIYCASKAYLKSFGKSMWFELHPYGVGITTVCPAAVATPLYNFKPSLMRIGQRLGVIKSPQWLVRRALRASRRGRKVISPSFMNFALPPIIRALPAPLESKIWNKIK